MLTVMISTLSPSLSASSCQRFVSVAQTGVSSEGTVLITQGQRPDDLYVLDSGRLSVEVETAEGTRMRLRTVNPGVVVGEVALYTGVPRTADVVAETPAVVLRLSKQTIEQIEAGSPELAVAMHRWLAGTIAGRLDETLKAFDALFD